MQNKNHGFEKFPLCIDLDNTLVKTDLLYEMVLKAIITDPFYLFKCLLSLHKGKAFFKSQLAKNISININSIPFNAELLSYIKQESSKGRDMYLVTAADSKIAEKIAHHCDFFKEVFASDGITNLKGYNKANFLENKFGKKSFSYAGDCKADLVVWEKSASAITININKYLLKKVNKLTDVEKSFSPSKNYLSYFLTLIRPYQWLKNVLVFVAPFVGLKIFNPNIIYNASISFFAFSFAASAIYIINDLIDVDADRGHPRKKKRPFASGDLPFSYSIFSLIFIIIGLSLSATLNNYLTFTLIVYVIVTITYTLVLKEIPIVDIFSLALLYTLRIFAGAAATEIKISAWLFAFSLFLFLALAFLKRCAEMDITDKNIITKIKRRGYISNEKPILQTMGIASSFASCIVMALYVDTESALLNYDSPVFLWFVIPVLLIWQLRLWLLSFRKSMHDDPLVFAMRDKTSWVFFVFIILLFFLAYN